MPKHYILRGYQHRNAATLTAPESYWYQYLALLYGVGGGKTLTSLVIARLRWELDSTLAILVITTQTNIAKQFIAYADCTFEFDGRTHPFPRSHTSSSASGEELRSYLSTRGNRDGKMVVTHSTTLLNCEAEIRETLRSGRPVLVIIDEGHHSPELTEEQQDELRFAPFIQQLQREYEKLRCLKLTGTPYRTDNRTVLDKDTLICSMRLVELMRDGYAPGTVVTDSVQVPDDLDEALECLVQKWIADGRPTVVIRIKHHADIVPGLLRAFQRVGATVINTTGPAGDLALTDAVERDERGLLPRGAVFLAKGRMIEGANVRTLTHVYFWGAPKSMVVLEQLLGRAMRLRVTGDRITPDGDYEPLPHVLREWVEKSKVTFFFGRSLEDAVADHARLLLRAVLFLSTFASPSWITRQLVGIKDGIPTAPKDDEQSSSEVPTDGNSAPPPSSHGSAIDQCKLALALEVIGSFLRIKYQPRIHPRSLIQIDDRPEAFVPHIHKWYLETPEMREDNDAELTSQDIADALRYRNGVVADRRELRSSKTRTAEEDVLRDVLDDLAPAFHEERYFGSEYRLDHASVDFWAVVIGAGVFQRIDGQPKTEDEIYDRVVHFEKRNGRCPDLEDEDPIPSRPVPFARYQERRRRSGFHGDWAEFVCSRKASSLGSDLREDLRDALGFASSSKVQSQGKDKGIKEIRAGGLREGLVVAQYYAEEIWVGGHCEIQYPRSVEPFEFLEILRQARKAYPTNRELENLKSVYRERGFNGLTALLGASTHAQAILAPENRRLPEAPRHN
jgi:Type III restriction enzyme, res subunit